MIHQKYIEVLKIIHERLNGRIPYAIIGSTNLALHGMDLSPRDIDIVTTIEGAKLCKELFQDFIPVGTEIVVIESLYNKHYALIFTISGVTLEISSEDTGGIYDSLLKENNILYPEDSIIGVKDIKLPCLSLKSELKAYSLTGRKDRVHLIEKFISKI